MGRQILCSRICVRYFALEVVLNTIHCVLISGCKSWASCTIDPISEIPNKWSRIHQSPLCLDGCVWETLHQVDLAVTHFTLPGWWQSDELRQTQNLPGKWGHFRKHFLKLWHCVWARVSRRPFPTSSFDFYCPQTTRTTSTWYLQVIH